MQEEEEWKELNHITWRRKGGGLREDEVCILFGGETNKILNMCGNTFNSGEVQLNGARERTLWTIRDTHKPTHPHPQPHTHHSHFLAQR